MRDDAVILSCLPQRLAEHEVGADGRVVVLQPRFGWKPLQALMVRWNRPHVRVKLDEVGSFTWLRCDGTAAVSEIVAALEQHFGDRLPQAQSRTLMFFRSLARSQLIALRRRSD
ncbi:MAG: PqqD family protein [Deltaproteobacteria bacterium]|nr:PqqD family protein [Deltaproteobacteria bacterium]